MKKLLVLLSLSLVMLSPFTISFAQTSSFNEIRKTLHDKSWYHGCPKCRDKFEAAFDEVVQGSNDWKKLVNYHCGCLMEDHREAEAISLFNKALEVDPGNYLFLAGIGTCYFRMNDVKTAEDYYIKSNKSKVNRVASYHLAHIHLVEGASIDPAKAPKRRNKLLLKAEKELNTSIELYKKRAQAKHISRYATTSLNILLAHIKWAQGHAEKAQKITLDLINNVEGANNWPADRRIFWLTELYSSYGTILYASGQQQEGIEFLNKAIATAPTRSLKEMKKILLDSTINPPKDVTTKVNKKYPHIKVGTVVPLY